ncbi:type 2 lanthipeptide synthetase LanM family protein [Bacillus thuringiensis]|uniref:type 2 lanthipeptide synthetase LanM family protein n=1 Tax=Bacillus thuringiensis TaxID=1428 RepID=UPI0020C318F1|nr:type 2 lanthipeptide synthetase LanM family protein [Bacillus thuringiensis]
MENNFIKSLTINERAENNLVCPNEIKTSNWFSRKTLLKEKDIDAMISQQYSNYDTFTAGIGDVKSGLCESFSYKDYPWIQEFYTYIDKYEETYLLEDSKKTIDYSARFLIQDVKKFIYDTTQKNEYFSFEEEFLINVTDAYISEIMTLMNQTIISDMNDYKRANLLTGKDKYQRFQSYLNIRFGNVKKIKEFYNNYLYAIKIIITRTNYFKENFKLLINSLDENFYEFKNQLGIKENVITSINMAMGDTHDRGKSVSILNFPNKQKIVYKPKNLEIAKKIDLFMSYLNKHMESNFYIPRRLVKEKYAFEEFVEQEDLESSKDAADFYTNYGSLLGLAYIINGSDFHYENIIAYKSHPVIIDMETFFHEPAPLYYDQELKSIIRNELAESVIGTSMLPIKIMKERSMDPNQGVDLSGLSFGRHKFPFNILVIKDPSTDEMRYEWDESYIDECNNVPTKNGKIYPYIEYKKYIYEGFINFLKKIEQNKKEIEIYIKKNFANIKVRQIVRPTQKYTDLLRYSYHPSCMQDAIEREKVLHNLWAYSYNNKLIAKYEFEEMMLGDIPQFFINTSEKHLYTNDNQKIENSFKETPLEIVIRKIKHLNKNTISQQLNIVKSTFQDFKFQNYTNMDYSQNKQDSISEEAIRGFINEINEYIIKNAIISEKDSFLTFLDINDGFETEVLSLSEGLYNGLSGVYIFLVANDYLNNNKANLTYRKYISNLILNTENDSKINAFFSKTSMIYPLLVEYSLLKEKNSLDLAILLADEAMEKPILSNSDWIYGSLNMIPVYYALYKITKIEKYLTFSLEIAEKIEFKESEFIGFAHGNSSLYYINSLIGSFTSYDIEKIVAEEDSYIVNNKWKSEKAKNTFFSGWCKGDLGIEISRISSFNNHSSNFLNLCNESISLKNNNTLCHGNSALLELLIQMKNKNLISSQKYEEEVNYIIKSMFNTHRTLKTYNVYSGLKGDSFGLFTGVSGVGYQLIRLLDNKLPNILLFETPCEFK